MKRLLIACLLCLPVGGWFHHGSNSTSPFVINIINGGSMAGAPSFVATDIQTAVTMLQNAITSPVTLNIQVDWGTSTAPVWTGVDLTGQAGAEGADVAVSGLFTWAQVRDPYQTYVATLAQSDSTGVSSNLPSGNNLNGTTAGFVPSRPMAKVFGTFAGVSARDGTTDGYAIFGTAITHANMVGVALHEITHAMGRSTSSFGEMSFLFGRFSSAGNWVPTQNPTASYLSVDGGVTNLVTLDPSTDTSDFSNAGDDVLNVTYNPASPYTQSLSALDLRVLRMMGYKVP